MAQLHSRNKKSKHKRNSKHQISLKGADTGGMMSNPLRTLSGASPAATDA